jgi:hypothetical protein
VEPPLRLTQLHYDAATGELVRPPLDEARAGEDALAAYLDVAQAVFDAAAGWDPAATAADGVSAEFEHLRWFDLPAASLT